MTEIWQWNTATTATTLREGKISAVDVAKAHLARLDEVNPTINAVTNDVREHALETAARLDKSYVADGVVGPLHGVPITIKENVDVTGQANPNGMVAAADVTATSDSPLVVNAKAAGAVIIGRTNTPELSYRWHTDNPLRGETRNPWSANRTAGGSSGGAAASIVSGIGTIAHGNDLGGSVRQPANCCGVAGLRPSLGRVPAYNATATGLRSMALQLMSVQGPLGREVADVRTGLEIMSQPSPDDPWHIYQAPVAPAGPVPVAATYGHGYIDPEAKDAIDTAARALETAGYDVDFVAPPRLEEIATGWREILSTEVSATSDLATVADLSADVLNAVGWMFDGHVIDLRGLIDAYGTRLDVLRSWTQFLAKRPLVLAPVSQRVPFAPNADAANADSFEEILAGHIMLIAGNYLGLPGAAVPAVLTPDGPVGVQILGAPFADYQCLDAAAAIEAQVGVMAERLWAGHTGSLI